MDSTREGEGERGGGGVGTPFEREADVLRALAHPVRLRIVDLLMGGELCVKRLEEIMGVSQSSVSQHLSRLRYAGLIESERHGHLVCYRLAGPKAETILRAVAGRVGSTERRPVRRARTAAAGRKEPRGEGAGTSDP